MPPRNSTRDHGRGVILRDNIPSMSDRQAARCRVMRFAARIDMPAQDVTDILEMLDVINLNVYNGVHETDAGARSPMHAGTHMPVHTSSTDNTARLLPPVTLRHDPLCFIDDAVHFHACECACHSLPEYGDVAMQTGDDSVMFDAYDDIDDIDDKQ